MQTLSTTITVLNHGGVAILPTETVFGLAGRADQKETVDRLYTITVSYTHLTLPTICSV